MEIREVTEDGDVIFAVDLRPHGIRPSDLTRANLLKTHLLADFIGEFLLRENISQFLDLLTKPEYEQMVRRFQHRWYGLWVLGSSLQFQFHASRLFDLINENLKAMLAEVTE